MEKRNLALFDFDGTISYRDSLLEFIKYSRGSFSFYFNMLLLVPFFILMKMGMLSNHKVKEIVLSWFFKGEGEKNFKEISAKFGREVIPFIIKEEALQKIIDHKKNGDHVVIVSATMDIWLQDWCDKQRIDLISSGLHFHNGKFSGKLATFNCSGYEKVRRIKDKLDLKEYNAVYAYGNSSGDIPMMQLADYSFYKRF